MRGGKGKGMSNGYGRRGEWLGEMGLGGDG